MQELLLERRLIQHKNVFPNEFKINVSFYIFIIQLNEFGYKRKTSAYVPFPPLWQTTVFAGLPVHRHSWITNPIFPLVTHMTLLIPHVILNQQWETNDQTPKMNYQGEITPRPRIKPEIPWLQIQCSTLLSFPGGLLKHHDSL